MTLAGCIFDPADVAIAVHRGGYNRLGGSVNGGGGRGTVGTISRKGTGKNGRGRGKKDGSRDGNALHLGKARCC